MNHTISPDRHKLTIHVDDQEREYLKDLGDYVHQDASMHDFLEPLVCNSELEWMPEGVTGDLTSAPMLGITTVVDREAGYRIHELPPDRYGEIHVGGDESGPYFAAIVERWAFEPYQVRSVLEDLRDKGFAEFVDGW